MKLLFAHGTDIHSLDVTRDGETFEMEWDGNRAVAQVIALAPPRVTFLLGERIITGRVVHDGKKRWVHIDGETIILERTGENSARSQSRGVRGGTGSESVTAPMPGQVRGVLVQEGDVVTEGQALVLLEAMKMEIQVAAPHDGIVTKLAVSPGQSVERDQTLADVERAE